jgi:predicted AAA+ superfamily ATPase
VVLNNGLLAGAGSGPPPDPESDPQRWGRWVENACLAHAVNSGREVHYWRENPWEVDAVLPEGDGGRLIEVKTGRYTGEDLRGLAHASVKFPGFEPVVLCDPGEEKVAKAAGFSAMAWSEFFC